MWKRMILAALLAVLAAGAAIAQDVETAQVSCASTATLAYTAPPKGGTPIMVNQGDETIWIGDANVTSANGFALVAGAGVSTPVLARGRVYCIVATGTESLHVLKSPKV